MAATADSTPMVETDFAAQSGRARHVDDLWRAHIDVLLEQAVDEHVEDKPLQGSQQRGSHA